MLIAIVNALLRFARDGSVKTFYVNERLDAIAQSDYGSILIASLPRLLEIASF